MTLHSLQLLGRKTFNDQTQLYFFIDLKRVFNLVPLNNRGPLLHDNYVEDDLLRKINHLRSCILLGYSKCFIE